jgi:hypothetical protein
MTDRARRKELVREYRERKQSMGIYAVRCEAANKIWIAASRNLDKQKNSLWFMLGNGGHPNRAMQSVWNACGEAAFRYEVLEEIDDENPLLVDLLLKERSQHWRASLHGEAVIG